MIKLRELVESDSQRVAELINNKNVLEQLKDFIPYPYHESDAECFINLVAADSMQVHFGIEVDSVIVGVIGLVLQNDVYRLSAELGYWLGEEYWGNGIMSWSVKEMVKLGFNEHNLLRIYSTAMEYNNRSQRVLEKSGFVLEAVLKKAIIKNNIIQDEYIYSILNDNF